MSSFIAIAAFAASAIVPAQPTSFQLVNLRIQSDACNFDPWPVRVTLEDNTFRVTTEGDNCSPPGPPRSVDVRLGMLPAGDYRVEVLKYPRLYPNNVAETLTFQVRDPAEIMIFPPPVRPLTDYSGLWYDPRESGWGLSLHQSPGHTVFGLLFVYDANRQPEWYSFQGGRWTSSTMWTASVFRTTGPAMTAAAFDTAQVSYVPAGTVSIDFTQAPGTEGRARLTYTINGTTATKTIQRMPL